MSFNRTVADPTGAKKFTDTGGAANFTKQFSTQIIPVSDRAETSAQYQGTELLIQLEIEDDRKRFWNMLVSSVPESGYTLPSGRNIDILAVACGKCREAKVLSAYFGGNGYDIPNPAVVITGIDIREGMIIEAREENSVEDPRTNARIPAFNCQFICGDATHLSNYPEIPKQVDVVVIRHEEMIHGEALWTEIFQVAINRLKDQGIGIVTSYTDEEHHSVVAKLLHLGCDVVVRGQNQYAKATRIEGISVDKAKVIFKKRKP